MPITQNEAEQIAIRIRPIFDQVLREYDFGKYPANDYERFKASFYSLKNPNQDIADALVWKWGHWGKPNFPQHHRDLIAEVERLWPEFIVSDYKSTSSCTFKWWSKKLVNKTRFITVAYITHLVHYSEPLPIIDQHNFRAMNSLIGCLHPQRRAKKKPSNWTDITSLKQFIERVCNSIDGRCSFGEMDRFLMMYGRNYVAR